MTSHLDQRFFFIHVMKTGGTSFADLLRRNFNDAERYPDITSSSTSDLIQRMEAYTFVPRLVAEVNANRKQLRIVRGHVPYAVRELLEGDYVAMTILRNPVERTLSYLHHCRRYHAEHRDIAIEDIYEQSWFFETFIHNYQTKLFSMTPAEALSETRFGDMSPPLPPRSAFKAGAKPPKEALDMLQDQTTRLTLELISPSTGVIQANEQRFESARKNLEQVDLVGVTEEYDRFLARLHDRYGWRIDRIGHLNASEVREATPAFRKRIAEDNRLDMDLYETARSLATSLRR